MNRVILQLLAVGFCFVVVQTLECYKCKFGLGNVCLTSKTTCESGDHCFSGEGTAAGFLPVKTKGCLKIEKCNQTTEESIPSIANSTVFTMTKTCCDTNLCNAAPGLPAASTLSLLATAVTALFVTKVLV